jgi:muconate cycloisomerase
VELTAFHVRIPLRKRVRHASHTRSGTDNIIIRCVLENGTTGFGEGVPREYVTGETIDTALELLRQTPLAAQLEACHDFPTAVAVAERLHLHTVPGDERGAHGNAARCAVELACLDAYGRHFKAPLSAVTRILAPELYKPQDWVRYSGAITSANGFWKLRASARRIQIFRFPQVKVKVGIAGHDDVRRLRIIRSVLRGKWDIRVDANEAWSLDEASARIRELEPFAISAVEQPVPHDQVGCLREIRQRVHTPIMLDESLCNMYDAEAAIAQGTCDLFNLRLSKCGGFIPTLRLAQVARGHGLGYQLGCQVGETAVLSAAGRQFASSVATIRYAEGSYDRHLVREALGTRDLTFRWGGWAPALTAPGLGVEVDPAALDRVTIRKEPLIG